MVQETYYIKAQAAGGGGGSVGATLMKTNRQYPMLLETMAI